MVERILGIDLGISSLGWAIVEYDTEVDGYAIKDCGVRLFTVAETRVNNKNISPALPRRIARGTRRLLNRRRVRMNEIKKLFISAGLIGEADLDEDGGMYHGKANRVDVWRLRYEALRRKLSGDELARVLIHIAKHRGYKFVGDEEDDESGKVKEAGRILKEKYVSAKCDTIGEWMWQTFGKNGKKRNKSGDYTFSIHRALFEEEVEKIFEKQSEYGSEFASGDLKQKYNEIAFRIKEPPSVEKMVGACTYFPNEKRAPKCSITAERFVAIGRLFSTVVLDNDGMEKKIVELKSIDELMEFAASKDKTDFKALRKFLSLGENQIFKGLHYKGKPKTKKRKDPSLLDDNAPIEWEFDKADAEKKVWINLKGHAKFKEALGDKFSEFIKDIELADEAAKILTYYKSEKQKIEHLTKIGIGEDDVMALSKVSFNDFLMLSLKAVRILYMLMSENGIRYDEALRYAVQNALLPKQKNEKELFLPPLKDTEIAILNPTVIRAFAEFRKVANALVRKYGSFDKVHFELAREVNTKEQRREWEKASSENAKLKNLLAEDVRNAGYKESAKNILKIRMFREQGEICPYCQTKLRYPDIFDDGCQIDHILPRSRSAEDSFANKVLVHSDCNQNKKNQTPCEWLKDDSAKWERFKIFVGSGLHQMSQKKRRYLLKENFDESSQKEFLERNLNDTRYMSKAIKTYCEKHWKLAHDDDKLRIQVRSGKLTSELRGRWLEGFKKDRNWHPHHALDAIIVALSTQSMVQKLHAYYKQKETRREKQKPEFKAPMQNFRSEVEKALKLEKEENGRKRLLISRPPRASVTGAAHKETIQSPKDYKGNGVAVNKMKGICDNGDMPRVDVFVKDGKYYLVPIYVADFAKDELPNQAIVRDKDKKRLELDMDYRFLFSLHKDDLCEIKVKNKDPFFGYFRGVHSGTAGISMRKIESDIDVDGIGSKTAEYIKKYQIDPLGYYHEVKSEKRLGTIPQEAVRNGVHERRTKKKADKKAAKGK